MKTKETNGNPRSPKAAVTPDGAAASVLTGTNPVIDGFFSPLSTSISQQLWSVAKIIADSASLGAQAQVFYADLGNFGLRAD